jgi:hypothetical protein
MARFIRVRFGRFSFDWDDFADAAELLKQSNLLFSVSDDTEMMFLKLNFLRILDLRRRYRYGSRILSPIDTLRVTREFLVSNDKDKVVGILGMLQLPENSLAKPQQKPAFCPGYTWSVDKVYVMFAKYLLTAGRLRSRLNESVKMLCHTGLDRQTAASNLLETR